MTFPNDYFEYDPKTFCDLKSLPGNLVEHQLLEASGSREFTERIVLLASCCENLFSMRLPYASNAYFFGAQLPSSCLGIEKLVYRNSAGRGTKLSEAFVSCMGELSEIVSIQLPGTDVSPPDGKSSYQAMPEDDRTWFANLLGIQVAQLGDLAQVPAFSISGDMLTSVPLDAVFVSKRLRQGCEFVPSNDGVGAGRDKQQAVKTALLELIERDTLAMWWFGGTPARRLDHSLLDELGILAFAKLIGRKTDRRWWMIELSNDFQIPVCCAASSSPNWHDIVMGYSAKPTLAEAAKSALLELSQMELASMLSNSRAASTLRENLSKTDQLWIDKKENLTLANYPGLYPNVSDERLSTDLTKGDAKSISRILENNGANPLTVDISKDFFSIPTFRAIVPNLQSMSTRIVTKRLNTKMSKGGKDMEYLKRSIQLM